MNRTLQLKMRCNNISTGIGNADNPLTGVSLGAVYTPDPEKHDFAYGKATPFGNVSFNVTAELAEGLEVGKKYLVDIRLAPDQD